MSDNSAERQETRTLELRDFLRLLQMYWAGAVVVGLTTVSLAAGWTILQPRVFESSASGVVQAVSGSDAGLALAADNLAKSKAQSYVRLAESEAVAEDVSAALGEGASPGSLLGRITASLGDDSSIIEITARGSSAEDAKALADAWVTAVTARVELLENPEGTITTQAVSFVALATAPLPTAPASPNVRTALILGALAGALLAVVYALVRNQLDRRIRSAAMIEREFGISVLGTLIEEQAFSERRGLMTEHATWTPTERRAAFAFLESLRELRTNLSYVAVDDPPRSILVVSGSPAEGKSTIAANLAQAVAASGRRVVLIDCDLRKPVLASVFNVEGAVGLTDILSGRASVADVIQSLPQGEEFYLIASGPTPPNPSEILGSRAMRDLVAQLSEEALVIVDAPPLLPVTDGAILSTIVDGTLLVVDAKKTHRDHLAASIASIRKVGGNILGVVLNRIPQRGEDARTYGYYGGSHYYTAAKDGAASPGAQAPVAGAERDRAISSTDGVSAGADRTGPPTDGRRSSVQPPADEVGTDSGPIRRVRRSSSRVG